MPTQQEIFQNKQREFNNQWKIDISIDNIEEELREIEPISNDIFDIEIEEDEEEKSLGTYVKIFDHVAETYMYQATKISGKQLHEGLKDFNTEAFLDSFEELMAAKPMPNGALKHQPYDGYDRNWLLSHFNKALKPYNKSVAQVWTDNVINDKVSVAEMRAVTERSYNSLQSDNEAPNALSDNGKAAIQNLIAARDTIANVRAQRSIAWHFAFWNWGEWIRESSYLSRLEKQLVELKDRGFTYDIIDAREQMEKNLVELKDVNIIGASDIEEIEAVKDIDYDLAPEKIEIPEISNQNDGPKSEPIQDVSKINAPNRSMQ